jgi:DUF1365 family protein
MNSCLYKAKVMHHRLEPKVHRFHYNVFMFYVDLDEIDSLAKKLFMFSRNRFNFFSFRDGEHLQLPAENPNRTKSTKQHILDYLAQNGVTNVDGKIMLLTGMNVLGYNFNPVSFYFCYDKQENPVCAVAEVSNTFREMKPFFLPAENFTGEKFHLNTTKYFYVSPFFDHDSNFDFSFAIPGEKLNIRIDTLKEGRKVFISTLTGTKKALNATNLLWYAIRFPFIPVKIISLIHWNALLLWLKKIPYHKKAANADLQRGVYRKLGK